MTEFGGILASKGKLEDAMAHSIPISVVQPSQRRISKSRERALLYHKLYRFHSLMECFTITHPMDVNARGGSRRTPLNAALIKGEIDITLALLWDGANINTLDRWKVRYTRQKTGV